MYKIAVAIPTSNYYGMGVQMLDELLFSIKNQNFDSIQVVVSDHSTNDDTMVYCESNPYSLNLFYFRNKENIGNPSFNHNMAIDYCDAEIIKVMQQDDYFINNSALKNIYESLSSNKNKWLVCGAMHTYDNGKTLTRPMYPQWNPYMLHFKSMNHIGGVSVVAIKKEVLERFDTNLKMLMDIEYYYRLKETYGDPIYHNELLICSRCRENNRLSSEITDIEINMEHVYAQKKHNIFTGDVL